MWGGVLDARKRLVGGEHVGEVFRALEPHVIAADAANGMANGQSVTLQVSGAADTLVSVTRAGCGNEGEEAAEVKGKAYFRSRNPRFVFSASARCPAPSAPTLF